MQTLNIFYVHKNIYKPQKERKKMKEHNTCTLKHWNVASQIVSLLTWTQECPEVSIAVFPSSQNMSWKKVLKAGSLRTCQSNQWVIAINQQPDQTPAVLLWSFCAMGLQRSYLIILTYTLNTTSRAAITVLWGSRCLCNICSGWVTGADQSTRPRCEVLGDVKDGMY